MQRVATQHSALQHSAGRFNRYVASLGGHIGPVYAMLADEEYLLDGIESFPWSPLVAPFGEGRTWGVDFNYEY